MQTIGIISSQNTMKLADFFTYRYCRNNGPDTTGEDLKYPNPTYLLKGSPFKKIERRNTYSAIWVVFDTGKAVFEHWHFIQCVTWLLGRDHPYVKHWEEEHEKKIKLYTEQGDHRTAQFLISRRIDAVRETCKELGVFKPGTVTHI